MTDGHVLVVDDDDLLRDLVCTLLERAGMRATSAADGREALRLLYNERPDLIVLDVAMPGLDGWETLARVREMSDVPVLMLTARTSELEKVRGLKSGADDYVTKPFGRQELVARVEALLRRTRDGQADEKHDTGRYDDGLVRIDQSAASVEVAGNACALTPLEYRLLLTLTAHPNQVLSREQLGELVWGDAHGVTRDQVKVYIAYLRRKLAEHTDVELIETVRGFGYRYVPPERS